MKIIRKPLFLSLLLILPCVSNGGLVPASNLTYEVCFTPGGQCTNEIVEALDGAKKQVLVQAYQLTSEPIQAALEAAHQRGVDVEVILDKSQKKPRRGQADSAATLLLREGIPTWIDYKPAIAHNKVMIIDDSTVITGSFNFSKAAQVRNAENLLILKDRDLAKQYSANWHSRLNASMSFAY